MNCSRNRLKDKNNNRKVDFERQEITSGRQEDIERFERQRKEDIE